MSAVFFRLFLYLIFLFRSILAFRRILSTSCIHLAISCPHLPLNRRFSVHTIHSLFVLSLLGFTAQFFDHMPDLITALLCLRRKRNHSRALPHAKCLADQFYLL